MNTLKNYINFIKKNMKKKLLILAISFSVLLSSCTDSVKGKWEDEEMTFLSESIQEHAFYMRLNETTPEEAKEGLKCYLGKIQNSFDSYYAFLSELSDDNEMIKDFQSKCLNTSGFKKQLDEFLSEKGMTYKDSILDAYNTRFPDYKLVKKWFDKKPLFLGDTVANIYKVLKRTTISKDKSTSYKNYVKDNYYQYLYVPSDKKNVHLIRFDIIEEDVQIETIIKINRGIMYEDKFEVILTDDFKLEKEEAMGRVKPFFDNYENHLIYGYKSNKEAGGSRVYFDLGYDVFDEDEKDSFWEYSHRCYTFGSTELNKTEWMINNEMLFKL